MKTKETDTVKYSYSYFEENETLKACTDIIIGKLPKIKMSLPKLTLVDNLSLSFC